MIVRILAVVAGVLAAGLPAVPAQAVPGLSVHTVVTSNSSSAVKSVSASCPAGKRVIGGGGIVDSNGDGSEVWITSLRPLSYSFQVTAVERDTGFAGNWWLRAFAICADPLPGLQIVSSTRPASSLSSQTHAAACPSGKRLIGAGGRVNDTSGQVALRTVNTNVPAANQALVAGHEDGDGYTGTWSVTAHAICADPVAGFSIASGTSAWDSTDAKLVTATCPSGQKVHGPLFAIDGKGDLFLHTLFPANALDKVTVVAREESPVAENWSVTALALCAA